MENQELAMGRKLKMFREIFNMSQEELGKKLNVSDKTISAWENEERDISLQNAISIAKLFNIPKEYFVFNENLSKLDGDLRKKMLQYEDQQKQNYLVSQIILTCKCKLESDALPIKKEYLPKYDYETKKFVDYGIFDKDNILLILKSSKSIDDISKYKYSSEKLAKFNLLDIIERFNSETVELRDLKDCNNLNIFKQTLEKMKQRKYFKQGHLGEKVEVSSEKEIQVQLNEVLENLSSNLSRYYEIIVFLIDNGAYYEKQVGVGDDITIFKNVKDVSKTNLIYRIAKDSIS